MIDKTQLRMILIKNAIIIVVTVSVAAYAIALISAKMAAISSSVVTQKQQAYEMSRRGETYSRLQSDFAAIDGVDAALPKALPPSDDISDFVSVIDSFGTQNGVNQSAQFNTNSLGVVATGIASIDYSLSISATSAQLVSYLQHFEKMPYFTEITGLTISSTGSTDIRDGATVALPARLFVAQTN